MRTYKPWQRLLSAITILSFSISSLMPQTAWANNIYNKEISEQIQQHRTAERYFKLWGAHGINDAYLNDLSEDDKDYVFQVMSGITELPDVIDMGNQFEVRANGFRNIRVRPVNLDEGLFQINNQEFVWNEEKSFSENVEIIYSDFIEVQEFSFNNFIRSFWPSAQAESDLGWGPDLNDPSLAVDSNDSEKKSSHSVREAWSGLSTTAKVVIGVAAAVTVGLLIYLLYRNNRERKNRRSAEKLAQQEGARANTAEATVAHINESLAGGYSEAAAAAAECGASFPSASELLEGHEDPAAAAAALSAERARAQAACVGVGESNGDHG